MRLWEIWADRGFITYVFANDSKQAIHKAYERYPQDNLRASENMGTGSNLKRSVLPSWWAYSIAKKQIAEIDNSVAVVLPCEVGSNVYFVNRAFNGEICPAIVTKAEINLYTPQCPVWLEIEYVSRILGKHKYHSRADLMLGEQVFLTREEAEAVVEASK